MDWIALRPKNPMTEGEIEVWDRGQDKVQELATKIENKCASLVQEIKVAKTFEEAAKRDKWLDQIWKEYTSVESDLVHLATTVYQMNWCQINMVKLQNIY